MGEENFTYRHKNWSELSMREKADMMKVAVKNGITNLSSIKAKYNEFAEGGSIHIKPSHRGRLTELKERTGKTEAELYNDGNPAHKKMVVFARNARGWKHELGGNLFGDGGNTENHNSGMTGMMKAALATAAHFGNPTARRMTNYDTRSYIWPNEYIEDGIFIEPKKGNVYVSSYDNLVTPQIQDTGSSLSIVEDVWSPENERRSYSQSLKFNNEEDARYFGEHYKEIAPMMHLYTGGGHLYADGGHLFDGNSEPINALYKPEENVVHRVTRVNGDSVGMDPDTGRFYDNTTGNYIGDHVALEDAVVTPQNGTIDDMDNIYQTIGGVTHMTTSDGKHIILGEKPVSNVDPAGEFFVEGTTLSPLFKPVERVVSGVLGAPEIVKSGKEIIKRITNTTNKKALDNPIFNGPLKQTVNGSSGTGTLNKTVEAAEKGRQALLDAVDSAWNRVRWQTAMPGKNVDIFIKDLSQKVKDVPFDFSKSTKELGAFGTVKPHKPKITTIGNTQIRDYNTGLDVYVGSDLGESAYPTSIHEPIHYMTSSSNGEPAGYISDGLMGKSYKMYNLPEGNTGIILRGKGYEHKMVDYNDNLLPPVDQHSAAYMAINEPSKLKDILVRNGRSSEEAESLVQSVSNHYRYMLDKQENQTYLKEFFLDKIKPHLKNPNDATEIENYLKAHPDIIENNEYIKELMTSTRPGSTEDYSKALAKMLYTITGVTAVSGISNTVKSE